MNAKPAQIACPTCRSTVTLSVKGNTVDLPLVCKVCGQVFTPHFYCPDANSPARHAFAATKLLVDSASRVYTFCPEHTFTTYALTAEYRPRVTRTPLHSLIRYFDSLAFRIALTVESWRLRLASRR